MKKSEILSSKKVGRRWFLTRGLVGVSLLTAGSIMPDSSVPNRAVRVAGIAILVDLAACPRPSSLDPFVVGTGAGVFANIFHRLP